MRAYFFGNMYMSSIQQGIQALHTTVEMYREFPNAEDLRQWADNHKTVILLNAGYSQTIRDIANGLASTENPYTWGIFHESHEALDGALTCAGIILPEGIYEAATAIRERKFTVAEVERFNDAGILNENVYSDWEVWMINELNNYRMAS